MSKNAMLVIYAEDGGAAKTRAAELRKGGAGVSLMAADMVAGNGNEYDRVIVMPDVPKFRQDAIEKAYGDAVELPPSVPAAPAEVVSDPAPWTGEMVYSKEIAAAPTEPLKRERGRPRKAPPDVSAA